MQKSTIVLLSHVQKYILTAVSQCENVHVDQMAFCFVCNINLFVQFAYSFSIKSACRTHTSHKSVFKTNSLSLLLSLMVIFFFSPSLHQPRHAVKLLSVLKYMAHRNGPDSFFSFPGKNAAVSTIARILNINSQIWPV